MHMLIFKLAFNACSHVLTTLVGTGKVWLQKQILKDTRLKDTRLHPQKMIVSLGST